VLVSLSVKWPRVMCKSHFQEWCQCLQSLMRSPDPRVACQITTGLGRGDRLGLRTPGKTAEASGQRGSLACRRPAGILRRPAAHRPGHHQEFPRDTPPSGLHTGTWPHLVAGRRQTGIQGRHRSRTSGGPVGTSPANFNRVAVSAVDGLLALIDAGGADCSWSAPGSGWSTALRQPLHVAEATGANASPGRDLSRQDLGSYQEDGGRVED